MAREAIRAGKLTWGIMNGDQDYRVNVSHGNYSLARRVDKSGIYWYAYKRHRGRLYKVYVGKQGKVTHDRLWRRLARLAALAGVFH